MENTQNHNDSQHVNHDAASKMKRHAGSIEAWLLPIFAKAPHLPYGGRKFITDVAPWLSLLSGVLGLFALASAGLITMIFSPLLLLGGGVHGISLLITIVLGLISSVLSLLSFNPLREMKKKGWDYAFYSMIIGAISTIVSMILAFGGIGGIIGLIIGAYLLFEVREMYH